MLLTWLPVRATDQNQNERRFHMFSENAASVYPNFVGSAGSGSV